MKELFCALSGETHLAMAGLVGIPLEAQQQAARLAELLHASVGVGEGEEEACFPGNAARAAVEERTRLLLRINGEGDLPFALPHLEKTLSLSLGWEEWLALGRGLRLLSRGKDGGNRLAAQVYEALCRYGGGTALFPPPSDPFTAEEWELACLELGRGLDLLYVPLFREDGRAGAAYALLERANLRPPLCFGPEGARSGAEYGLELLLSRRAATGVFYIGPCQAPEALLRRVKEAGARLYVLAPEAEAAAWEGADLVRGYPGRGGEGLRMRGDGVAEPWPDAPQAEHALRALLKEAE